MLLYLTLIFCCQLMGELITHTFDIPVPGPVLGMLLLFCWLILKKSIPEDLAVVSDGLLNHLSLLFVPAGVGVMMHFRLLGDDWVAIGGSLLVSTTLTILVTALMMTWLGPKTLAQDKKNSKDHLDE